jgi:acetate---CoA ligase (ADP-forming)
MDGHIDMDDFFSPRSIAVVGASNANGKMGNLFVQHLMDGFPGKILPVNPKEEEILGLPTYPDFSSIPEPVDLLIPLIPAEQLLGMLKGLPKKRVKFLLAIPSGFGEVPGDGKPRQMELIRMARELGIRVVGPNSLGMLNCPYGLNASMIPERPPGGVGLSCITQSGGFGMAVYMYTVNHCLAIAKLCDLGNTADVSVEEILDYFLHDTDTNIVGLFLESLVETETVLRKAREVAAVKPLIITLLGRTQAGRRASLAHIGRNITGVDQDKWLQENAKGSIIATQTGLEMLHVAKGLSFQPLPRGRRVAILTGSGGLGAELVDLCVEMGLEVPEFSDTLQDALKPSLPPYAGVKNPVDSTPIWWKFPKIYPSLLQELFASEEIDILIVTVIDVATTVKTLMSALTRSVAKYQQNTPTAKPIYVYWASTHKALKNMRILESAKIPCYQTTIETVRAVAAISEYAAPTIKSV